MTINEMVWLMLALPAGVVLGTFFFGGLWWTVRKGVWSEQPASWFFGSLLLRMSVALAGFYLVGNGDWRQLLLCLIGFVAARLVVTRLTRNSGDHQGYPESEARHAP
jgi:F1F0 ATPase subunit 2